jgi:hypothetical protein
MSAPILSPIILKVRRARKRKVMTEIVCSHEITESVETGCDLLILLPGHEHEVQLWR